MKPRLTLLWAMALLLGLAPAAIAMEGPDLVLQGARVYPSPAASRSITEWCSYTMAGSLRSEHAPG